MKSFGLVIGLLVLVLTLWVGSYFVVGALNLTLEQRGQFGDMFGAVNSLFTGLAFAGLIATIFLQRDELALQRTELQLQRDEMILSRGELANQAKVQHAQYLATLGQIKVASKQALIEEAVMRFNAKPALAHAETIQSISEQIHAIAKEIEAEVAKTA
jgi:hypothetical protein